MTLNGKKNMYMIKPHDGDLQKKSNQYNLNKNRERHRENHQLKQKTRLSEKKKIRLFYS